MTTFTGTFSYGPTNRPDLGATAVSATGNVTLSLNVDAAAGALLEGSIWGSVTGTGTISNYMVKATGKPGFPHTGSATHAVAGKYANGAPDINDLWTVGTGAVDSVWFDGSPGQDADGLPVPKADTTNGLDRDGTSITGRIRIDADGLVGGFGKPDIVVPITLTGPAVPTLYNLAEMSSDVEIQNFSLIPGWTKGPTKTHGAFQAFSYVNSDHSQAVIAIRGTVADLSSAGSTAATFKTMATDIASFSTNIPTVTLINMVKDAVDFLATITGTYSNAHITLTGHSLGGAVAQMLGKASNYSTVAFNGPGPLGLYSSPLLSDEIARAQQIGQSHPQPGSNVDVRTIGDWVSLQGDALNLVTLSPNSLIPFPDAWPFILANHDLNVTVIPELKSGTTVSNSIIEQDPLIILGTPIIKGALLDDGAAEVLIGVSFLADAVANWLDPTAGTTSVFTESTNSPAISSVTFLYDPGVSKYEIWYQAGDIWSTPQTVSAGAKVSFAPGTHAFKYVGLSSSGQVVALPEGFLFNATFAEAATVTANLHILNLDNLNGVNVQMPTAGQTSLTVNSSFSYTDAGNATLTVNGTASANDTIVFGSGTKTLNLGNGNDFVMAKSGTAGTVVIHGGAGDETILAGAANVTLVAGSGDILFIGGDDANANAGIDTIDYSAAAGAVNVNLATGIIQTANAAITTLVNVENVSGSRFVDHITGDLHANRLSGGGGADLLVGGAGNDKFNFDLSALADAKTASPIFDEVKDFAQGNTGSYSASEADQIDLSAVLSAAYNLGHGQSVGSLIRAVENPGNTFALLQVDPDGAANGVSWITIAQLDGLHTGNNLSIVLDASLSAGATIAIGAPSPLPKTTDYNGDSFSDILFRNNSTGDTGYTDIHNNVFHSLGGSPTAYSVVGSGDYNGDKFNDILFRNNATGDTGYTDLHNNVFRSLGGSPTTYRVVGSGDYNGDNFSDILFRNNATGDTGYTDIHNNVFHSLGGSPVAYSVVGSGDYNGDGFSDILFRNNLTGDNGYTDLHNNVFHSLGGSPVAYSVVGSGDYNGDNFADILFRNNSTGDTGYTDLHNNVFHSLGGSPVAYSVVGSGDYNGDSFSDILFRNNSTGDTGYTDLHNNVFHSLGGSPAAYLVMA
jgi:hypothetical protein